MPKQTPPIVSFNSGEVSPLVDARFDINKYMNGCRTLENFIPLVEGGIIRTPGTYFVKETKDSTKKSRLFPFKWSSEQSYQLEFGDQYIRFYKDNGNIVIDETMNDFTTSTSFFVGEYTKIRRYVAKTATATTKTIYIKAPYSQTFAVGTVKVIMVTHGTNDLSIVESPAGTIVIQLANATASKNTALLIQTGIRALGTVGGVDVSEWVVTGNADWNASPPITCATPISEDVVGDPIFYQCLIASSGLFPPVNPTYWLSVNLGDPVEIVTPYLETELFEMKRGPQSADILYLFHKLHPPAKLVRHSHINWEYTTLTIEGSSGAQKVISAVGNVNPALVTIYSHGFVTGNKLYFSGCEGMTELNGNIYTITVTTANQFTLNGTDATGYGTYSARTGTARKVVAIMNETGEYPSCATFFEQRLAVAGMVNNKTRIKLSGSGDYENFVIDEEEDSASIEYDLVSEQVEDIRWLIGEDFLLAGTLGGIWRLGASSPLDPMTQTNILARKNIFLGASNTDPQSVLDAILFLTLGAMSVRQITWSDLNSKYIAPNLTRLASHIAEGSTEALSGILEMAFQQKPIPILWGVRRDGQLVAMTYEIEEQVYSWFRVVTDGVIESVSTISGDEREDQVWIIVKRTIEGVDKRYVEYFTPVNFYSTIADSFFVHSGLTTTLTDATQLTGLLHLASENVDVMIGGIYIGRKAVSGAGVVTLGGTYSGKCHVGLPFTSKVEPMKLNIATAMGTSRGKRSRINEVTVVLHETFGGKIGPDASNLRSINPNGTAGVLVTDDYHVSFPGTWADEATLCVVQDEPYPMTVLALIPYFNVNES